MQDDNQSPDAYPSEKGIHIIYNTKFYFSDYDDGKNPSWCHLKILQGTHKTLVILSQPKELLATRLYTCVESIVTHITNRLGLDPALTMFLEYNPPKVPVIPEELKDDPMIVEYFLHYNSPGDGKFERITFQWSEADAREPVLDRYSFHDPSWSPISPGEAAKLRMELEKQ